MEEFCVCGDPTVLHVHVKTLSPLPSGENNLCLDRHHCINGSLTRCSFCLWQSVCVRKDNKKFWEINKVCPSFVIMQPQPFWRFAFAITKIYNVLSVSLENPIAPLVNDRLLKDAIQLRQEFIAR